MSGRQCGSTYAGKRKVRGCFSTVFCTRDAGHVGDHRGDRKQWKDSGKKVVITLPADAR